MINPRNIGRHKLAVRILGALICAMVVFVLAWEYNPFPRHRRLEELATVREDRPAEFARRIRKVAKNAWSMDLDELSRSRNDDLGLAIAWEKVVRRSHPEEDAIAAFLMSVESATGSPAPRAWKDQFGFMEVDRMGRIHFRRTEVDFGASPSSVSRPTFGSDWELKIDGELVKIPAKYVRTSIFAVSKATVDRFYVASFGGAAYSYFLLSFDRRSGEVVWCSRVWADCSAFSDVNFDLHFAELVISKDKVNVFGISSRVAYIESFDLISGKNLLRFCTRYLGADELFVEKVSNCRMSE